MEDKLDIPLINELEEAERKGREEGHQKGMADVLGALSAAAAGDRQEYIVDEELQIDGKTIFRHHLFQAMINAAKKKQTELVLFLLTAGADVNTYDENGHTALHIAIDQGNTEMVTELLEVGAETNCVDANKQTPLSFAVETGHVEVVKALLAAGADVHCGDEPEHAEWLINYEVEGDHAEMTQTLLEAGAYKGPDRDHGWTPLMEPAAHGKAKAATLLIKAGCDVNAQNYRGKTVLMKTAKGKKEGTLDTIRLLLKLGAEINYQNGEGRTALMAAAAAGRSETVHLLLSAGADVFSKMLVEIPESGKLSINAFDVADDDAIKEIIKSEMHRRIAAVISVLPDLHVGLRQTIVQLYIEEK